MKCCNKDIFNYRGLNEAEIDVFFFYTTIPKLVVLSQSYGAALLNRTIPCLGSRQPHLLSPLSSK